MEKRELTAYVKAEALRLGFDVCGITGAGAVDNETIARCNSWIGENRQGTMHYLERNCDKRYDPTLLVNGCKSIIVVAMNYAPRRAIEGLSHYAQGSDYHKVMKDRLFLLLKSIGTVHPIKGRPFCDSAPVLERYWATRAGIGWIGKNRQLIIPERGSLFFIGELLVDAELEYDTPNTGNHCGNCRRCIDACPTNALTSDGFDARKCLSYLTIEHRGELPENIGKKMNNCFYGCDRCQDSCPHNRFATPNTTKELQPSEELLLMDREKWNTLNEEQYHKLFSHSAVERCGYEQLVRNINALNDKAEEQ